MGCQGIFWLWVCSLSGPVLRDTARLSQRYPPIARYGFLVSQHDQLGAIPPTPFLSVSPLESMRSRGCDTPPPSKGVSQRYWRDTTWKQGKWVRYPPLRYYLERVLRDMGGISHWATKSVAGWVFQKILREQHDLYAGCCRHRVVEWTCQDLFLLQALVLRITAEASKPPQHWSSHEPIVRLAHAQVRLLVRAENTKGRKRKQ